MKTERFHLIYAFPSNCLENTTDSVVVYRELAGHKTLLFLILMQRIRESNERGNQFHRGFDEFKTTTSAFPLSELILPQTPEKIKYPLPKICHNAYM